MTRGGRLKGGGVVWLPEVFLSAYFWKRGGRSGFGLAEPIPGPATQRFEVVAAESGTDVIVSLFEKRAEGLYHNTAAYISTERGYVGKYRKMHIPDDPLFYEKFYFTPGDLGSNRLRTTTRASAR